MILMGRVAAPFGVKGWVKVEPWSAERTSLCSFPTWWVGTPGKMQEVAVTECREHGAMLIAHFEGCEERNRASTYSGSDVAVKREDLPQTAKNEFYQADLIGLDVVNVQGEQLGRVAGFFDNGAHGVMRVEHQGGERLVPLAGPVVRRVDLEAGVVEVDWGADW